MRDVVNMSVDLKIKKLNTNAVIPHYATDGAACFDLTATEFASSGFTITYKTGLAFEIPQGYVGLLYPRSSVAKSRQILANSVGVIDSDYRGEVMFKFHLLGDSRDIYAVGDRVGQMMIMPIPSVTIIESTNLNNTERGEGGFGSTGS